MIIETDRLEIIPLTGKQLKLSIEDMSSLEKELNFTYKGDLLEGFFLDIFKSQLKITLEDEDNYMYHTFWFIIRKEDRICIGSSDFKDVPNENGEIEIGYGITKPFEHKGYMTECVQAMCTWGLNQKNIKSIIAETECDNIPSQNVLKRCSFKKYKEEETMWWRLDK